MSEIAAGDFPEWELGLQVFDQKTAGSLDFDVLDPTKVIPEEVIPLRMIGRLLNRNVDNFFAETEQVAFCPANIVPGIGFSNDPLLQGRLFSYLDTQLSRLGGPNFHQLPVTAPRCPFHNQQRDGIHQMEVPKGRAHYEPNSIDSGGLRENPSLGYQTLAEAAAGEKTHLRSETADPAGLDRVGDAFAHSKVLGFTAGAQGLLDKAAVEMDDAIVKIAGAQGVSKFIGQAKQGRHWNRELKKAK